MKLDELNELEIQFEKAWEAALIPTPVPTPAHSDANTEEKEATVPAKMFTYRFFVLRA